jgi:hypothetical protein
MTREQGAGISTRKVCQRAGCTLIGSPSGGGGPQCVSSATNDLELKDTDTLRRCYTHESAMLLHVLGLQGNIPTGPLQPLCMRSLLDKVSMYKVN